MRLQVAIAAGKIADIDAVDLLTEVLCHSADDPLIPQIVWQNLNPRLDREADHCLAALEHGDADGRPAWRGTLPRICERLLATRPVAALQIARVLALAIAPADAQPAFAAATVQCLDTVADEIRDRELAEADAVRLQATCALVVAALRKRADNDPLRVAAVLLAASWDEETAVDAVREILAGARIS